MNIKEQRKTRNDKYHSNELWFYPYSVKISKSSSSCNNINDPFAKLCVPDVVQNMNVKSDSQLPKKYLLFASMIALQKWRKMFFI